MTQPPWMDFKSLACLWWFIRYRSSKRKARLYTVACCRQVWRLFVDPAWRKAVEVSEQYADKMCDKEELNQARIDAEASSSSSALLAAKGLSADAAGWVLSAAVRTAFKRPDPNDVARYLQKAAPDLLDLPERQRLLFHELAGPRLFGSELDEPAWLTWNDGAICKMAKVIYEDRAFGSLPLLADALEEAGCCDAAILAHCRSQAEHVKGCWVIDLLLGKK